MYAPLSLSLYLSSRGRVPEYAENVGETALEAVRERQRAQVLALIEQLAPADASAAASAPAPAPTP
jgi:hypothetical protein